MENCWCKSISVKIHKILPICEKKQAAKITFNADVIILRSAGQIQPDRREVNHKIQVQCFYFERVSVFLLTTVCLQGMLVN